MDINTLRPLPPFSWHEATPRIVDHQFFDYYRIDFSVEFASALKHHFGLLPLAGYDIAVHYFSLPSNTKTAVLNHGYYDHVGLYGHLIQMLLELGCNVLAYDLPGHGLSSGEQAGIGSFADYQQVLDALLVEAKPYLHHPVYIVGQSTGAAIAMDYVMNYPQHGFAGIVLLAPLVIPMHWIYLKLILSTLGWFMDALPRDFAHNSHDDSFLHFLKYEDPLQSRTVKRSWGKALVKWQKHFQASPVSSLPALLIQGDGDTTVNWRYNIVQIDKKFTSLEVIKLKGARHHLANETEMYRNQIRSALEGFLQAV